MKKKVLMVSNSFSTGRGIASYLQQIFGRYIQFETSLTADVMAEQMEKYELVLFASKDVEDRLKSVLTPQIHYLVCIRTFNFSLLNKIFSIPFDSSVYLVNNTKRTAEKAIRELNVYGFSQYHFVPYWPDCGKVDESIRYAVTLGEGRYVPEHVITVVDIGVRVVDVSTIAHISSFLKLPMELADIVTQNYMNQFIQLLKMSNYRTSQTINSNFVIQNIINKLDIGICLLNSKNKIALMNDYFRREMNIYKSHLLGISVVEVIPELEGILKKEIQSAGIMEEIIRQGDKKIRLTFQKLQDINHENMTLLHLKNREMGVWNEECLSEPQSCGLEKRRERLELSGEGYQFQDYRSVNKEVLQMLETAKRISQTEYRVLIQGETGTGKEVLARAIHNYSGRSQNPFIKVNLLSMNEKQALQALSLQNKESMVRKANGGTLYLDGIHHLSDQLQRKVLGGLEEKLDIRLITSTDSNLYEMCCNGDFQKELFYRINEVSLTTIPIRKRPEDIPLLFEYFLKNIYSDPQLPWRDICSEGLWKILMEYSWPGNGREIENICKYFFCVKTERKLTGENLPYYIQKQIMEKEEQISTLERQILIHLREKPKIGRAKLFDELSQKGMKVTEGKIRSSLSGLAERGLIRMNRTKGGCEITDKGEMLLI